MLSGVYLPAEWRLFYSGFRDREPVANVENSIRVFWVDQWPETVPLDADSDPDALGAERALADVLHSGLKWPEHAIPHYQRYLRARPGDPVALYNLGLAQISAGDVDAGISTLRQVVAANPQDGAAQANLAMALLDQGRPQEASGPAEAATVLMPANPWAWRLYGRALELAGRRQEAAAKVERAVALNPTSTDARTDLARLQSAGR